MGSILKDLCHQFGVELIEGHAMPDHVHLCLSIPPKLSVANPVGRIKGKSAAPTENGKGRVDFQLLIDYHASSLAKPRVSRSPTTSLTCK